MSDDETYFDEDDIAELYENENQLTPEEVFTMVTLNSNKKVRVTVELKDKDGDIVSLPETVESILNFVKEKLNDEEGNQLSDQIFPLMCQSVVSGLGRMLGIPTTALMLAQDNTKIGILYMMCIAFLLLKFVQNNDLKIQTYEEPVTDEEIESIQRKAEANKLATIGLMAGMDPKEILEQLVNEGRLTQEDIDNMSNKKKVS